MVATSEQPNGPVSAIWLAAAYARPNTATADPYRRKLVLQVREAGAYVTEALRPCSSPTELRQEVELLAESAEARHRPAMLRIMELGRKYLGPPELFANSDVLRAALGPRVAERYTVVARVAVKILRVLEELNIELPDDGGAESLRAVLDDFCTPDPLRACLVAGHAGELASVALIAMDVARDDGDPWSSEPWARRVMLDVLFDGLGANLGFFALIQVVDPSEAPYEWRLDPEALRAESKERAQFVVRDPYVLTAEQGAFVRGVLRRPPAAPHRPSGVRSHP